MSESTRVWVKTCALEKAVYGKVKTTAQRSIPGSAIDDSENDNVNWGWARGTLVKEDGGGTSAVKVFIEDEDSAHDRTNVELPADAFKDGDVVVANIYGDGEDSDEEDDYGRTGTPGSQYPDDLITLTHLHEPAVVHCLRKRYEYDKIYTATGPILLALNPFKHCKALYSDTMMKKYWDRGEKSMMHSASSGSSSEEKKSEEHMEDETELPPHVYSIADNTFRSMISKLEDSNSAMRSSGRGAGAASGGFDQSILVSGESGAGKTVTTKFIMQYLATLSQRSSESKNRNRGGGRAGKNLDRAGSSSNVNIESQVLKSNPILESFGNARTIRNDNSSRFGKFIEIQFTNSGSLVGASIETYLLEKVRLITQAEGERNYHIFYELLQGMEEDQLDNYFIGDYTAEDFKMTNGSGTYDRRDGVDDCETYQDLLEAMDTMGFTPEEQTEILTVTCAVLHLSNLTFNSLSADESEIDRENPHLDPILNLMGFTSDNLNRALCYFSIVAGREKHTRSLPKQKAEKGVEALIKATYGALFTHIVQRVNASITIKDKGSKRGSRGGSGKTKAATIGVLDIFGFESFKVNSFEQLCINYCNEALQQQFNMFVLKKEQEEYEREGIKWSFISFPENQDVLDLIDKKGSGILNILDDQCRAPGTTDKTFANDIYQKCTGHGRFEANFRQVGARQFGVHHYAGTVEYDTEGFVEKNRDELPKEATELLLSSSNEFVKKLAHIISPPTPESSGGGSRGRKKASAGARVTVGGQFSKQLQELRQKIDLTSPHYVRCLKPNDQLVPDHFDPVNIVDQLRCAGVIEAVRVSRVGYPQRYPHSAFVSRYRILGLQALKKAAKGSRRVKPVDALVKSIALQIQAIDSEDKEKSEEKTDPKKKGAEPDVDLIAVGIQVGKTKVFLRRHAYEVLERLRGAKMSDSAVKMQAAARRYIAQMELREAIRATILLQCCVRRMIATEKVECVRRHYNATLIQTMYRQKAAHYNYVRQLVIAKWLQRVHRGAAGRAMYETLNRERKSIIIQKYWRAHNNFETYKATKKSALIVQCAVRCLWARIAYKGLRAEARDLQAAVGERDELRKEMQRLQNELDAAKIQVKKEADRAKAAAAALSDASSSQTGKVEQLQADLKRMEEELTDARSEVKKESERADKAEASAAELENTRNEIDDLKEQLNAAVSSSESYSSELEIIKKENDSLKEKLEHSNAGSSVQEVDTEKVQELEHQVELLKKDLNASKALSEEQSSSIAELKKENEELLADVENKEMMNGDAPNESLQEEIEHLKRELEEARTSAAQQIRSEPDEQSEVIKKVQEHPLSPSPVITSSEEVEELLGEIESLKRQIGKNSSGEVEQLQLEIETLKQQIDANSSEEVERLQREIEYLKSQGDSTLSALPPLGSHTSSGETQHLQQEIRNLKRQLIAANKKTIAEAKRADDAIVAKKALEMGGALSSDNTDAVDEILTLQDEVSRLNEELAKAREAAKAFDPNDPKVLVARYEELRKLSDAVLEKDREIEDLKEEVNLLNDELDEAGDAQSRSRGIPIGSTITTVSDSTKLLKQKDDAIKSRDDEIKALQEINELLRQEMEATRKESDEAKRKLREEAQRSAMELEAFSETLRGVDELRKAAESMSRELNKSRPKRNGGGGGGGDDVSVRSEGAWAATSAMEEASRILDASLSRSEPPAEGNQLWDRVKNSFMLGANRELAGTHQRRPSGGSQARSTRPSRSTRQRRRRRKQSDDESIISAFF